ncbi:hypothetical protein PY254_16865 [Rhodanobacter sp. AS-Z3]|uniref:hypothetical protein n=1 Tax=Rhodanobacter sp. AS-Z3 TaxID=3031330 RepID=UPI0024796ADC|nr:hypothetical protein [Rhodanobacter sp. AS-Z3]WEN14881.1 hypothetical protein PY254_16865 [Rhodanobacter sp. AS-Z3]
MFSSLLHGLPYQIDVWLHVAAGSIALATFWTAAAVRKGGQLHRNAGKLFMLAMCGILATGVMLVLRRFADGNPIAGTYLGYLFFITGQACWLAWRAVQDKADWRVMVARPAWRMWMWSSLLAGIATFALGMQTGNPVLLGFSLIGPALFVRMWRFARRGPTRSNWHVILHYQSILGAGIAAHVAFLGVGMAHVWPLLAKVWPSLPPALIYAFPWYAPIAMAVVAVFVLNRRHGSKGRTLARA